MNLYSIREKVKNNKLIYPLIFRMIMKRSEKKKQIRGRNNKLENIVATYKFRYAIKGDNNIVRAGKGTKLCNLQIVINGSNNKIIIGDQTDIKSGVFWIEGNNCLLKIGNEVSIEECNCAVVEDNKEIIIGDHCLLSYGITLRTGDSHSIFDNETGKRINYAQNIHIGTHAWIGANATILKGVEIADNAIVGAAAVVTKNVLANTVVGGNPAKVLKENISWDRRMMDTME